MSLNNHQQGSTFDGRWWIVLVLVPIVIAIIGITPEVLNRLDLNNQGVVVPTVDSSDTPVPTHTPAPSTNMPIPSPTPIPPSDTPVPSPTPIPPSDTPVPSPTPIPPTNTPIPSPTPIPPSATPAFTHTPVIQYEATIVAQLDKISAIENKMSTLEARSNAPVAITQVVIAPPTSIPTQLPNNLIFFDDFSDNSNGWELPSCVYLISTGKLVFRCGTWLTIPIDEVDNFYLQVDVSWSGNSDPEIRFGNFDRSNYHYIQFDEDEIFIDEYNRGSKFDIFDLDYNFGQSEKQIAIWYYDGQFEAFVDDEQFVDVQFKSSGGQLAIGSDDSAGEVIYDNLEIRTTK